MPLDQMAGDADWGTSTNSEVLVAHSGRHESAVSESGDAVVVTVLLQQDTALPGEHRRCAAKVESVDFDRFPRAMARGVQAEILGRGLGQAKPVDIEGLE